MHDLTQGWSRTVNVAAAVAAWLGRRGATVRAASAAGRGHDLVVALDGEDVHVEVTGWPPDGPRTHPTVLAGDWFSAAASSAGMRRQAHPRARVVIALPETRRYRALTADRAPDLARAGHRGVVRGPPRRGPPPPDPARARGGRARGGVRRRGRRGSSPVCPLTSPR